MDWFGPLVGAVAGLFGGAVGGILTAARITRSSERAKTELTAENRIRAVVRSYRATLQWDAAQLPRKDRYSEDYASISGQERLAVEIVRELPAVRASVAKRVDGELESLFGRLPLALARQRALIDGARIDEESEAQRQTLTMLQILKDHPDRQDGMLPALLHNQNDSREQRTARSHAIALLDRIEDAVTPRSQRKLMQVDRARIDQNSERGIDTD